MLSNPFMTSKPNKLNMPWIVFKSGYKPGLFIVKTIPGIERDFTLALQDLILNQTNLDLVKSNGDIFYEGEIVGLAPLNAQ